MRDRLCTWLTDGARTIDHSRFIDIHIDEIDARLKSPEQWIRGIQWLLTEGTELLAAKHDGFCTLAGCIALRSSSVAIGINFSNQHHLISEFTVTPPSLYMFIRSSEPWRQPNHGFVRLGPPLRFSILPQAEVMYLEYQDPSEFEFRRSLRLVPPEFT